MLEHHTLQRPKIASVRRRPSTAQKLNFDESPMDNVFTLDKQSSRELLSREKVVPAPPATIPPKPDITPDFSQVRKSIALSLQISQRESLRETRPRLKEIDETQNDGSINSLASTSQKSLARENKPEVIEPETKITVEVLDDSPQVPTYAKSRKWVQVLGFMYDKEEVKAEQKRTRKLAKRLGAKNKVIKFMLQQIVTVEDQEKIISKREQNVESLKGRLLLGAVRTVDPGAVRKEQGTERAIALA